MFRNVYGASRVHIHKEHVDVELMGMKGLSV